jgi:RNA polymerase sigma-70 factor (ECF subfamily)
MQELEDAQLVRLALKNNDEAMAVLVARYLKQVYSFIYTYLKNSADAEDVTQEVFVKVWRNLSKFDLNKPFRPWIYQIAKNTSLDRLKKHGELSFSDLENEAGEQWLAQSVPDVSPLPQQLTDRQLLKDGFVKALGLLPAKYAEVLVKYHMEELNFREIAQATRLSINTVKSRYRRAISRLAKIWPRS